MNDRPEIDRAIASLKKEYGDRTVARAGDKEIIPLQVIPTGIFSFDRAIGCGGWPRGRISEIYGPPSNGKTAVMLSTIAQAQRMGLEALFVDAEQSLDLSYAEKAFGIDTDSLIVCTSEHCEQAFAIINEFVSTGVDLIVVDSVEGLVPRAEMEGEVGESFMGVKARLMNQALRKLKDPAKNANTAVIFINQIRQKIGVVYGNPDTTPGGDGLKFWSSVRVDVRRALQIKEGDALAGMRLRAKVIKNKVATPHLETEFDYYYGTCTCHRMGFDLRMDLLDAGVTSGVIEKSGNTYSFAGEKLAVGRGAASLAFENTKLAEAVQAAIVKAA